MNRLIIGLADKTDALPMKQGFLLIDDGPIADHFLKKQKRSVLFDPMSHSFNPLHGMTYRQARDFTSVVYGAEGKDTLTVRNGKRALTRMVLDAKSLDDVHGGRSDADKEAQATVDDILLSPVIRDVLCRRTNFSFKEGRSIVAKLNRADLGDYDAFVLASLLISQFKGQIIIPDFGFYARPHHSSLIRENRLVAGVNTLSELDDKMRQLCLLMDKEATHCTYEDAEVLAQYAGQTPRTDGHDTFVKKAMGLL
jgi:hypothetical protein